MKIKKIDHIAIASINTTASRRLFEDVLGLVFKGSETVDREGVITHFFGVGDSDIEVLEPLSDDSPVKKFLDGKGEGIHHVAFEVEGLDDYVETLKAAGIALVSDQAVMGAHNKRIIFIHPKSTGGILIELSEQAE